MVDGGVSLTLPSAGVDFTNYAAAAQTEVFEKRAIERKARRVFIVIARRWCDWMRGSSHARWSTADVGLAEASI
jgi:hypothetical protein